MSMLKVPDNYTISFNKEEKKVASTNRDDFHSSRRLMTSFIVVALPLCKVFSYISNNKIH